MYETSRLLQSSPRLSRGVQILLAGCILTLRIDLPGGGISSAFAQDSWTESLKDPLEEDETRKRKDPYRLDLSIENDNKLFGFYYYLSGGQDGSDYGRTHAVRLAATKTYLGWLRVGLSIESTLFTQRNGLDTPRTNDRGEVMFIDGEGRRGAQAESVFVDRSGRRVENTEVVEQPDGSFTDLSGTPVTFRERAYFDKNDQLVPLDEASALILVERDNIGVHFNEITEFLASVDSREHDDNSFWRVAGGTVVHNRERITGGGTGQQIAFHTLRNKALPGDIPEYNHFGDGGGVRWGMILEAGGGFDYMLAQTRSFRLEYQSEFRGRLNYIPKVIQLSGSWIGTHLGLALGLGERDVLDEPLFGIYARQDVHYYPDGRHFELITRAEVDLHMYYADLYLALNGYWGSPVNSYYIYNENNSTMTGGLRVKIH